MLCPFKTLSSKRRRVGLWLTFIMMTLYFGFLFLVGFGSSFLARSLIPGLTVGIVLGVFVIVVALGLTIFYVLWANSIYDPKVSALRKTIFLDPIN